MKKSYLVYFALCISLMIRAQATDLVVDCQTPGWLSSKINYGDQQTIRNLKVTGYLNTDDLTFIGSLINSHSLDGRIDLYDVQIVNNDMGINSFGMTRKDSVKCLLLPQTLKTAYAILSDWVSSGRPSAILHTDTLYINWQNNSLVGYDIGGDVSHLSLGENIDSITDAILSNGYGKSFHGWQCNRTFDGVSNLQSVQFPKGMRYIGQRAFNGLKSSNFNDLEQLEFLGQNAFNGLCPDTIKVPKSLHNPFYLFAFAHKDGQHIFIEDNISTISGSGSKTSSKLIFHINNSNPPAIVDYNLSNEAYNLSTSVVYVPKGAKQAYLNSDWKNATIIELNPVEAVTLSEHQIVLNKEEQFTLSVSVTPEDADDMTIEWKSEDESVASVNVNGVVTAIKEGETRIYATSTATGIEDFCTVLVRKNVTSISLEESQISLANIGDTKQLIAVISPDDATDKSVTWKSSNEQVCSVSGTGLVTATGVGTTLVTVTTVDGGLTATCVVKVIQHVDGVTLNKSTLSLNVGESEKLQATITPSNADNKNVIWTSSDEDKLTVDQNGVINALKAGEAIIFATSVDNPEAKATCKVTVFQPVNSIALSPSSYTLNSIGQSVQLNAIILPEDASNTSVTWKSTNEQVVTVTSDGLVTAIGAGTAAIIATTVDGGLTATCSIKVVQHVNSIALDKTTLSLKVGETEQLHATVKPDNADNKSVLWSSSDENILTVDQNGVINALKAGEALIIATSIDNPEAKASCRVTVLQPVNSIALSPNSYTFNSIGQSVQLSAIIQPEDASNKSVTWMSTNEQVVTITSDGLATATGAGTAAIIATTVDGGLTATCSIKVVQHVNSVILDKTVLTIKVGDTEQLHATILPENADDKNISWSSSDETTLIVDQNGIIKALKAGDVYVYAVSADNQDAKASCRVNVIQPVTGITISQSTIKFTNIGESVQLTAMVQPEDASNKTINWNSSNMSVCAVSNGLVVATGEGTAVIIATSEDGGFMTYCTVTVDLNTGVDAIQTESSTDTPTYNIMGRRIKTMTKGRLYIRNGKKYIAR